ncbi:TPA: Ltp family lipoprotein [Streptococcus equi subsp. zooepidemicus]|nr:Ltp family lipoprotein [Streptococcus equi subsp. zooepidemicus]HEL0428303.1 Ltp family lipoprotein [Streptococcus equi subsp. zooepidemicus]HEL0430454.1 Ltp family lipoprotein [Streptococcus equi subsp. zooepidemicus]HEL0438545.1 Ltp family lipoprotein [Streptococcus equi subsp. zooepidemicus]
MKKKTAIIIATAFLFVASPAIETTVFPQAHTAYAVSKEYKNALEEAEMLKDTNFSKKAFYEVMQNESGFEKKAVDYAVKKLKISWKKNALASAKELQNYGLSKKQIKETLLSTDDGGGFTKSEANYAIKHLEDED